MTGTLTRRNATLLALGLMAAMALPVAAQSYPGRNIKIVVPYPPGSPPDALARVLAEFLAKAINQTVLVDNKPGVGGMLGAKAVSESAPDGNTLLMFTPAWSSQKVFFKNPLIPVPEGLVPVTLVGEGRLALTAAGSLPANGFNDMVNHAKANPGKLNFATTGAGDTLLYFHSLLRDKGMQITTIQYKGSSEYIAAMMAGDVQLGWTPEYSVLPFVKSGRLKVLAVTGATRSAAYPEVPTFQELGLPKIRNNWMSLFAPRGTPPELVAKLNADLVAIIKSPEGAKRIRELYFEPVGSSPEQLRSRIQTEMDEWGALAKAVGLEPQ